MELLKLCGEPPRLKCEPAHLWKPVGARGVFGGQLIALCLAAAYRTVANDLSVHSLHLYFTHSADPHLPIDFDVQAVRDSRSFSLRRVTATQRTGVCEMLCSFMRGEQKTVVHQAKMPTVVQPESLLSDQNHVDIWLANSEMPKELRKYFEAVSRQPPRVEMRSCRPPELRDYLDRVPGAPKQCIWIKMLEKLPDTASVHACLAAYLSDHRVLQTALLPHAINGRSDPKLSFLASLDHALWFHVPCKADEWLLYELESPRTSGSRGVAFGKLWTRDGQLVATCAQEGIIRTERKSKL